MNEHYWYSSDEFEPLEIEPWQGVAFLHYEVLRPELIVLMDVDERYMDQIQQIWEHYIYPAFERAHLQYGIPLPIQTDFPLPARSYDLMECVVDGKSLDTDRCSVYLRFYQKGEPDIIITSDELGPNEVVHLRPYSDESTGNP